LRNKFDFDKIKDEILIIRNAEYQSHFLDLEMSKKRRMSSLEKSLSDSRS